MKIFRGLLSFVVGTRILGESPKVGEVFILDKMGSNPFEGEEDRAHATVMEIKDGWVKYKIGAGLLSPDTAPIRTFLTVYTKKTDA